MSDDVTFSLVIRDLGYQPLYTYQSGARDIGEVPGWLRGLAEEIDAHLLRIAIEKAHNA